MMSRRRIVFVPVDERFCTRDYFILLAEAAGLEVVTPPLSALGRKKTPPDIEQLRGGVLASLRGGDTVIASVDMLVHGGLIPSRISRDSLSTLSGRLSLFPAMKRAGARVYASVCVTRAPFYNSAEEEPEYWAHFGERLWNLSRKIALFREGCIGLGELRTARRGIPDWIVEDFLGRRKRNFRLVSLVLDLVAQGEIEFLNLTLDDNTEGSISLWESERHAEKVERLGIRDRVSIHAGADESTLTLLSRFLCDATGSAPRIRVEYSSDAMRGFVPPYEGSPHELSVRSHLKAAGCRVLENGNASEDARQGTTTPPAYPADALLFVHNPTDKRGAETQRMARPAHAACARAVRVIEDYPGVVGIAGTRYVNGSDNRFIRALLSRPLDWSRLAYAGWNTAGNTLGTAISFMVVRFLQARKLIPASTEKLARLQAVFLLEHWAYMADVRGKLLLHAHWRGCRGWELMSAEKWAIDFTAELLEPYAARIGAATHYPCNGAGISFPWHRAFEIRIELP